MGFKSIRESAGPLWAGPEWYGSPYEDDPEHRRLCDAATSGGSRTAGTTMSALVEAGLRQDSRRAGKPARTTQGLCRRGPPGTEANSSMCADGRSEPRP